MGNIFEAIWDDMYYGNPTQDFIEWRDKYWQLCHPEQGGTLWQRKGSFSFTKKYTIEMLRELFDEGWKPEEESEPLP